MITPILYIFIATVLIAAVSDLKTRRIPNAITVSGLVIALILRIAAGDGALIAGIAGLGLAAAVMIPLFMMRGVGGGDAKLMMMVGAFLGTEGFLVALLGTALIGGAMSLIAAVRAKVVLPVLMDAAGLTRWVFTLGRRGERTSLDAAGTISIPYGIAIAAGSLVAVYIGGGIL